MSVEAVPAYFPQNITEEDDLKDRYFAYPVTRYASLVDNYSGLWQIYVTRTITDKFGVEYSSSESMYLVDKVDLDSVIAQAKRILRVDEKSPIQISAYRVSSPSNFGWPEGSGLMEFTKATAEV